MQLRGWFGYQLMLEFEPDERIENVSIGDALGWQVTPNRRANLLFLKPVDRTAATNMTVVTDKRRYAFDLVVATRQAPPGRHGLCGALPLSAVGPGASGRPAAPAAPRRRRPAAGGLELQLQLHGRQGDPALARCSTTARPPIFSLPGRGGGAGDLRRRRRTAPRAWSTSRCAATTSSSTSSRRASCLRNGKTVTTVLNDAYALPDAGPDAPKPAGRAAAGKRGAG